MVDPTHLPYSDEAELYTDIVQFFTEKLPHAIGDAEELVDEAVLSRELFENLSACTDDELAEMGIHRDDISKVAAAAAGLFVVANNRKSA